MKPASRRYITYGFGWRVLLATCLGFVILAFTPAPHPIALGLLIPLCLFGFVFSCVDRARLVTPRLDHPPQFHDSRFEEPGDWVVLRDDASFTQRYLRAKGPVFCETIMKTGGDPEHAISLLRGPWHWWNRGYSRAHHERPDGATDQILIPVSWYWCHVRMRLLPPVRRDDGGWRIPAVFAGSFAGCASFDLHQTPEGLTIRGRFHAVTDNIPLIPADLVTRSHLWAESGILFFPFPKGTGWLGLRSLLEAHSS